MANNQNRKERENGDEKTYRDFSRIDAETMNDASCWINQEIVSKEPPFPVKLHMILSNPEFQDIIFWLPHGRSWRILKQRAFEEKVIPRYFRHGRYASFARQVNGWGFRRVTVGIDLNSYYHELFLRGMSHLCNKMRRFTAKDIRNRKKAENTAAPNFYELSRIHPLPANGEGHDESENRESDDDQENAEVQQCTASSDNSREQVETQERQDTTKLADLVPATNSSFESTPELPNILAGLLNLIQPSNNRGNAQSPYQAVNTQAYGSNNAPGCSDISKLVSMLVTANTGCNNVQPQQTQEQFYGGPRQVEPAQNLYQEQQQQPNKFSNNNIDQQNNSDVLSLILNSMSNNNASSGSGCQQIAQSFCQAPTTNQSISCPVAAPQHSRVDAPSEQIQQTDVERLRSILLNSVNTSNQDDRYNAPTRNSNDMSKLLSTQISLPNTSTSPPVSQLPVYENHLLQGLLGFSPAAAPSSSFEFNNNSSYM